MRGNWDYRGRLGVGRSPLDPPIPPRGPVTLPTPPRWWLRLWKSSPETSGKAYSEAARPRRTGQQPLAGSSGPEAAGPGPARCPVPGARGRTRDPYHKPLPGWRPGCSGLPPPPGVLPASSSGTSRHRLLRETRVPKSHSRRLQPAFQAAPDPQLPLQAGSHFRPAPAELAEVRRAGNGRTRALASGGWGWGGGAGGAGGRGVGGGRGQRGRGGGVSNFADRARRAAKALGTKSSRAGDCGRRPRGGSACPPFWALRPASYQCPSPFPKNLSGGCEENAPAGSGSRSDSRTSAAWSGPVNFRCKNKAIPTEKAFLNELTGLRQWSGVVKHSDYLTTKKSPDGVNA